MTDSILGSGQYSETAKQRVLDAIDTRQIADFSALPDDERSLAADFLQRLIGSNADNLCCTLRIRGARIVGPLLPPTASPQSGRAALQFRECLFDSPVDLSGAEFLMLRFVNCHMPAFIGASLRVSADLDLSGCVFSGVSDYESELSHVGSCAIHLNNARIGGRLDLSSTAQSRFHAERVVRFDGAHIDGEVSLNGALLDGRGAAALSARSSSVGSNVVLKPAHGHRFESHGEVALVAAQITGDLSCDGARLLNPEGRALHCEDMSVESVALSDAADMDAPFEASGRLNFLTAIIGGSFFLTNARLAPGPDLGGLLRKGGPVALNLQQVRISNALGLRNISALDDGLTPQSATGVPTPVQGWFLLTGAEINTIVDNSENGWPAAGYLDVDGVVYKYIRHVEGGDLVSKRIKWLRRQYPQGNPDVASFRPQPYEQLSSVLRQHGLTREANAVAVEKIRMRLLARVDDPVARLLPKLLMLLSNHGYSSSRALMSFLIFVLLGTIFYASAVFLFQQPFMPVENPPEPTAYRFAFGLLETSAAFGCPGLDVMQYALDAALPVIDLGQDQHCIFAPTGAARELWLLLHSIYIIIGAALSAVVVLTLTGLLRQD